MFERMLKKVLDANKLLWKYGLVTYTWGNVSEIDRLTDYIAINQVVCSMTIFLGMISLSSIWMAI